MLPVLVLMLLSTPLMASHSTAQTPLTPVLGISAADLDFGLVVVGDCGGGGLDVYNAVDDSTSILEVINLQLTTPFSFVNQPPLPIQLRGNGSLLHLSLRFCPGDSGSITRDLSIVARGPLVPEARVPLTGRGNLPPIAEVGNPYGTVPGEAVAFDGRFSHDPDGRISRYTWDFGDGNAAQGAVVSHTYSDTGSYRVELSVTDTLGATGTSASDVRIEPPTSMIGNPLENLDYYRVCFQGIVLETAALIDTDRCLYSPHCTFLTVLANDYFIGSGPDTVHIRVEAVDAEGLITLHGDKQFRLPAVADTAFFWISGMSSNANIRAPQEIWIIRDGRVQELDLSADLASDLIEHAAVYEHPATQRALARYVVRVSYRSLQRGCEIIEGHDYHCHELQVDEQYVGPPLGPALIMRTEEKYIWLPQLWRTDRGVLFLAEIARPGVFLATHPILGFFPQVGNQFVAGYRVVHDADLDRIEPVLASLEEIIR